MEEARRALLSLTTELLAWFRVIVMGNDVVPLTENDVVTLALVLAAPDELVLVGVMLDVTLGGPERVADWARLVAAQRVRINTKRAASIVGGSS